MTFPKNNVRIACIALLDQCCTVEGLINYDLANFLRLLGEKSQPKSSITATGTFTTNHVI